MPAPLTDAQVIAAAPLSPALRALAVMGGVRRLKRNTQIITEGDVGDTLFIVLSGRLCAFSEDLQGRSIVYGEYGAGEYVGEMGLDGGPRSASVKATELTMVAVVTRVTLQRYLKQDPDFAFELLGRVIRRARNATRDLRSLALNDVKSRLKQLLEQLTQAQPDGSWLADPAPTHGAMAERLGCGRAMVSRVLKVWEREGYLLISRKRLQILKKLPESW
jgi:CRP/FNR family cyclic AMP-dependent transcriptional regulator